MNEESYKEYLTRDIKQELSVLQKELANATSLKNTYHDNWQELKETVDSQAKVINNLTKRWGNICYELAELKDLVEEFCDYAEKGKHHITETIVYNLMKEKAGLANDSKEVE